MKCQNPVLFHFCPLTFAICLLTWLFAFRRSRVEDEKSKPGCLSFLPFDFCHLPFDFALGVSAFNGFSEWSFHALT